MCFSSWIREAAQKFERTTQEADRERYNLSNMIGTAKEKRHQLRDLYGSVESRWPWDFTRLAFYTLQLQPTHRAAAVTPCGIPLGYNRIRESSL